MRLYIFFILFFFLGSFSTQAANTSASPPLIQKNFIEKDNNEIQPLNQFFKHNSPLKIHNKAVELLKNKERTPAVLLLKRNFYQNLFPPSYFLLNQLRTEISFSAIFLLIAFFIISIAGFILFILYLKNSSSLYLKNFLTSLFVFLLLLTSQFLFLKDRVSVLTATKLKLAPIESAPTTILLTPLEEAVVLKKTEKWLRIKSHKKETGWILKQQAFPLF